MSDEGKVSIADLQDQAVEVSPLYALGHVLGLGCYSAKGDTPTADDLHVALVLLAYDPESESVIRLPILFDPEYAVRAGFVTQEALDAQRIEALASIAGEVRK